MAGLINISLIPLQPEDKEENWSMDDEMFVFRKEMTTK